MNIKPIKTHRIEQGDSLEKVLTQYLPVLVNKDIVIVTSKIISIIEGRLVPKDKINKRALIYQEADLVLKTDTNPYDLYLTVKNGLLLPSAGIDESNVDKMYVLYPKDIQKTAIWIWDYLKSKYHLTELGVVITDSHTTLMRRGVTGIALGWCGFKPFYSYIGLPDIYDHPLKVTQINILDSLAVPAVFVMGEGNEQTPLAMIKDAPKISFSDKAPTAEEQQNVTIPIDQDLYGPLLRAAKWEKSIND